MYRKFRNAPILKSYLNFSFPRSEQGIILTEHIILMCNIRMMQH